MGPYFEGGLQRCCNGLTRIPSYSPPAPPGRIRPARFLFLDVRFEVWAPNLGPWFLPCLGGGQPVCPNSKMGFYLLGTEGFHTKSRGFFSQI